ncbi:hypothetical protein PsYK624_074380 [Phanerochaete sordida]|uniref:Restriction of telomere capping protein 4 n=1 Tax=Phanerochaete sordida TaxID=48140 RepID=A0A9P3GBF4_9APHY|nr:hypothetical protein PsYK624_074380 [Phanerochaete sordida]
MEQQRDNMLRRGTSLATDSEARMKNPPRWSQDPAFAPTLGPAAKQPSSSQEARSQPRPKRVVQEYIDITDSDSDDELLIVSESRSRQGSKEPPAAKSRSLASSSSRLDPITEVALVVDGQAYPPHPDFQVDGKQRLKDLKFQKLKKSEEDTTPSLSEPSESSSRARKPAQSSSSTARPVTRDKREDSARKAFKPPAVVDKDKYLACKTNTTRQKTRTPDPLDVPDVEETPKPVKPKPKPRIKKVNPPPELAAATTSRDSAPDFHSENSGKSSKGKAKATEDWPMADMSPPKHSGKPHTSESSCPIDQLSPIKEPSNERKALRSFPMDNLSPLKDKAQPARSQRQGSEKPSRRPIASFPDLSPLSSPAKPPPSSSSFGSSQGSPGGSGRRQDPIHVSLSNSDSESELPKPPRRIKPSKATRPFPMGSQMLRSMGSQRGKRGSSDAEGSEDETERRLKKRARGANDILRELMHSDGMSDEDDDLLFNDPDLDPARLCPWCDEMLPPEPSPHLKHLMTAARRRSSSDSRPTNPLGLRAQPTVFVNVCQRHRFESHQIPLAQRRGWPTRIDWAKLAMRVRQLKHHLQRIVDDVDEEFIPGNERSADDSETDDLDADAVDDKNLLTSRPRKGSAFWKEVVKSVRKKGARKAAGVRGQMTSFTKTQPGYYGELGSVIISQTIYDLFPPAEFTPVSTLPLTPTEFIQRVLVPEAALRLVMEDMKQSRSEALKTLRDSAQYGVAMFPDDNTEGTVASEAIVKARAAARRKEIERQDEEDSDAALWNAFPEDDLQEPSERPGRGSHAASVESSRPRRACAERAQAIVESGDDSDASIDSRPRKTRAKPGSKSSSKPASKSASKPAPKPRAQRSRTPSANSESGIEILSGSDVPQTLRDARPGPRPRPRPKVPGSTPHASDGDTDHGAAATTDPQATPRPNKTQRGVPSGPSTSGIAALNLKTE